MWRQVHNLFKETPLYAPEYFAPLPVVPSYRDKPEESNETLHTE